MKQVPLTILICCLWFLFFGFSAVMAEAPARMEYTAAGLRNPFKRQFPEEIPSLKQEEKPGGRSVSKLKKEAPPPQIVVEGIIWGREISYAIIAGKVFGAGDKIGEAVITVIGKEGITVVYDLERFFYPGPSQALTAKKKEDLDKDGDGDAE